MWQIGPGSKGKIKPGFVRTWGVSWSNRSNSKTEACDSGAPGAGAKLLAPRKRKRASERSERASEASERVASLTPPARGIHGAREKHIPAIGVNHPCARGIYIAPGSIFDFEPARLNVKD